ncbi:MAG: hypothetical protein NT151_05715 [Acidobacteria bacterium]|nr:hypothetical protein [Acidobacteriota bacterium]
MAQADQSHETERDTDRHDLDAIAKHETEHLAVSPLFREGDVDRFFVDIHPHEHATFRHDGLKDFSFCGRP